jgi:IclR family acetate operon transcriptional repressor
MMTQTDQPTIGTVERAVDVLTAFTEAEGPTLGVTELARQLGLSKAVVHRILTSLRAKGLVSVDENTRRYSLGPAALALGLAYLRHIDVRDQARGLLRDLCAQTNETATLSIRRGDDRIYVDQVTPPREVMMTVQLGHPYPLHAGASSKAFLAQLPDAELARYLSRGLEQLTAITVTDPESLRRELAEIRAQGCAISYGERQEGAGSVAAPVFDHEGRAAAVVSVCGPVERFRREVHDIAPILVDATERLSRRLGWEG